MKKFSILEAQSRLYGGGTPFSNGHRSKSSGGFLENWHYLIDLDMIIYDNDSIKVIVEKKFKPDSKMGNILTDSGHFQKKMLLNLCKKLNCKLFVNITSQNKFYEILDSETTKEWSPDLIEKAKQKYYYYDSDDSVFIEFRKGEPVAIMKRIADGLNIDGLLQNMSNRLTCNIFKIDDLEDSIYFFDFKGNLIGQTSQFNHESQRPMIEIQWKDVYQKMNLW
jgi:hypothetical protein